MMSTADLQLGLLHQIQISNLSTSIMEDFEVEGYYDSNNTSDYVFDISVSIFNATSRILVPTTFFLLALMGLVGNCSVMFIICRHTDMQTVTNYFIANLAITDVATVLFCILPTALQSSGIIPMSTGVCKGVNYIQFVTVQATCCTLTAMSIDRYFLIVHAVRSRRSRTTNKVLIINVTIWAVSFMMHSPVAVVSKVTSYNYCETVFGTVRGERVFQTFATLSMYVVPLIINLVCYISILLQVWTRTARGTESAQAQERAVRRKRKITRMVFVVVLLFAVCWAPKHFFRMWIAFDYVEFHMTSSRHYVLMGSLQFIALCLAYGNSCVNPFVYAFTTTSFKKYFKKVFKPCCRFEDRQARTSVNQSRVSKVITGEESLV
ncbi:kiSS-1 receptor-like [Asterias amurensis]|uniref:kiSS-1 receptor-like n=1 Tax=Asterias amurensis TaxID=7602 RepID=UPI003AB23FAF